MTNMTVNELLTALQAVADEYGHLPVAVAVQPDYPLAGNVKAARVTGPAHAPKLHLFANTDEYGPAFDEDEDEQHIETVL